MRRIATALSAMCAVALPQQVLAAVYDFQDTESSALSSSPVSFSFALDTSTANVTLGTTSFSNVVIDDNGTLSSGNTVAIQFSTNISSPLFFLVDTNPGAVPEPFSSGAGSSLAFNLGNFNIADGMTDGEGVLAISLASPASSVPEPSSWVLMVAGVGLMGATLRLGGHARKPTLAA